MAERKVVHWSIDQAYKTTTDPVNAGWLLCVYLDWYPLNTWSRLLSVLFYSIPYQFYTKETRLLNMTYMTWRCTDMLYDTHDFSVFYLALPGYWSNVISRLKKSYCDKSWSVTTRTINYGSHICDLCLWIDALLHSLWETKILRNSNWSALVPEISSKQRNLWPGGDFWLLHVT